jgi:hypothetical protein
MMLVVKECKKCKKNKQFVVGTPREEQSICGDCWNWEE